MDMAADDKVMLSESRQELSRRLPLSLVKRITDHYRSVIQQTLELSQLQTLPVVNLLIQVVELALVMIALYQDNPTVEPAHIPLWVKGHVPQAVHGIVWGNCPVPSADQIAVHVARTSVRPAAVSYYVVVSEMMIGRKPCLRSHRASP